MNLSPLWQIWSSYCLFALDTKYIINADVVSTVKVIINQGQQQYYDFINKQFLKEEKSISEDIKRNKPALFSNKKNPHCINKTSFRVLKSDLELMARLYITCQTRGGKFQKFLRFENQPQPQHPTHLGELRSGSTADLLISLTTYANRPSSPAVVQLSETPGDENPAIFYDSHNVPP
jgi:hypothetical protein